MLQENQKSSANETADFAQPTAQNSLNARHYQECIEKRGLNPQWVLANCHSVQANVATQYLGYTAQSDGIWLEGCNHQSQFKPDKPWKQEGDKKAPKYRSALGEYDAMLPTHPTDPHYWHDISALKQRAFKVDGHPCLLLTEGFFKAIAACFIGIPTIALLGVEMGLTSKAADPQGKRYLVATLERYALAGFGFVIGFDADCANNPNVIWAQRKLAHQLKLFKVPIYSITGLWTVEQGKGMDDFIQNHGGEKFIREVLGKAVSIETWEQQFPSDKENDCQSLAQGAFAASLAEKYRPQLAYHTGIKRWLRYGAKMEGIWSEQSDESIKRLVMTEVRVRNPDFKDSYINGIIGLLKADLAVDEWDEQPGLLPLQDGVLELATMKLLEHAPGYRLLWCLPYSWKDRAIGHQPIEQWLTEAMKGDLQLVQMLRAYLKAVVTGRVDLQRYLECLGPGGTGKGTFMRLAMALVGKQNTHSTTLKQLEENRFEAAAIFGKRLLLITDAERYGGEVSQLKAITGQDLIRYERKNVQQGADFEPTCMVIVAANEAVQSGDYTSGLERRRLTVPWIHQVKSHERRDLDAEFRPHLPGLLQWVLEMPDNDVTSLVRDTAKTVRSLQAWKAESLIETNPLAEWLDFCLAYNPSAKTYVGVAKRDKSASSPNTYLFIDKWLYASYCEYSAGVGSKATSGRRFSGLLHDLCVNQLKLEGIKKGRDEHGSYFEGLVIRQYGDTLPRIITGNYPPDNPSGDGGGGNAPTSNPSNPDGNAANPDGNETDSDANLTAEPRVADGTDGSDGKIETHIPIASSGILDDDCQREQFQRVENPSDPSGTVRNHQRLAFVGAESTEALAPQPAQQPQAPDHDSATETTVPSPWDLAAQILQCQSWVAAVSAMDAVSAAINKDRAVVFKSALKHVSLDERQYLVGLLAAHIQQFPRDRWAYSWLPESSRKLKEKALTLAARSLTESGSDK